MSPEGTKYNLFFPAVFSLKNIAKFSEFYPNRANRAIATDPVTNGTSTVRAKSARSQKIRIE